MKKEVTRESSKVKALKERFERNQVKNVLPAENKTASATPTGNKIFDQPFCQQKFTFHE